MGWWLYYFVVRLVLKMEGGTPVNSVGVIWNKPQEGPSRPRCLLSIWVGLL